MLWCFRTRHRVLRAAGVGAPGAALPCLAHALCLADGEAAAFGSKRGRIAVCPCRFARLLLDHRARGWCWCWLVRGTARGYCLSRSPSAAHEGWRTGLEASVAAAAAVQMCGGTVALAVLARWY